MPRTYRLMQLIGPDQAAAFGDILTLARYFSRQGHTLTVAGPLSRLQQEQVTGTGARWVNLPIAAFGQVEGRAQSAQQLRRLLQAEAVELLHCYGLGAATTAVAATRFARSRPKLLVTLDDLSRLRPTRGERWRLGRLLGRFAGVVVASDSERAALAQISLRLACRARALPYSAGVRTITADFDLARKRRTLGLRAETAVIGVISPAVRGLGLEAFIRAAGRLNETFPNVEFLIVGDGPDQQELILQAHNQGSGGAIVFRRARTDIAEIIATLNVLVLPREVPGSILYALQALTQEIPVVAVRSPALEEIIAPVDPEAFVPEDDVEALVRAISKQLEILPPPELDDFSEQGFSYRDMVVSGAGFDLDQMGLEASWRGDESQMQQAVRAAQDKYTPRRTLQAVASLYEQVLA